MSSMPVTFPVVRSDVVFLEKVTGPLVEFHRRVQINDLGIRALTLWAHSGCECDSLKNQKKAYCYFCL